MIMTVIFEEIEVTCLAWLPSVVRSVDLVDGKEVVDVFILT